MNYGEPRWLWGLCLTLVMAAMLATFLLIVVGWPLAVLTGNWSTAGANPEFLLWTAGILFAISVVIVAVIHWAIDRDDEPARKAPARPAPGPRHPHPGAHRPSSQTGAHGWPGPGQGPGPPHP